MIVKEIVAVCDGELFCGSEQVVCTTFTKDTRTIHLGDTYIGIKGATFDGNLFYQEAFLKGANCVILEKSSFHKDEGYSYDKPIILVDNSIDALKKLAVYKRDTSSAFFVGVTGSVGKTSTRDMVYSVLKQQYRTLKTEGNYNNHIGLPLTMLRLKEEEAAVIEMGMSALGEIEALSQIVRPNIGIITNIGTAHIGVLGSRENILQAKLEILSGMDEKGILIINNDNDLLHQYYEQHSKSVFTVGIENQSDVMAKNIELHFDGSVFDLVYQGQVYSVSCPVPGMAFVYNSLVAFAVGIKARMDVSKILLGIESFSLTENRLDIQKVGKDITFINDVYNASVDSMNSSLAVLKNMPGRKLAVLGSMLELGRYSEELHRQVGKSVWDNQIDYLITVGEDATYIAKEAICLGMKKECVRSFLKNSEAVSFLSSFLSRGDTVLFKASNGMHFKGIVEQLREELLKKED